MKFNSSSAIYEIEKNYNTISVILFYGNEAGLISSLIKSTYNILKKKTNINNAIHFDYKNNKKENIESVLKSPSLFSKKNFIIVKNPQEELIQILENINNADNIVVINGEGLRANSKIRFFFEHHKNFIGVSCYKLNKKQIKTMVDNFFKYNKITIQKEGYSFLIDNICEDYLSLENELKKICLINKSPISLEDIKTLISKNIKVDYDEFFFNCVSGNSELMLRGINSTNISIGESFDIFRSLKNFINILSNATTDKDNYTLDVLVKKYLPKYLFLKTEQFKKILKKTDLNKVVKINELLQKTEYLLKKNSEQHKEVLERFIINLDRAMK